LLYDVLRESIEESWKGASEGGERRPLRPAPGKEATPGAAGLEPAQFRAVALEASETLVRPQVALIGEIVRRCARIGK